ncbi:DNA cytosine methyltransferase [Clostridium neonatale]|uniref:DNA cytosine methyltransferase n=1 Tax=Clostridium neonatale TaxID=137838 RepID=UPI00291B7D9A|nr:DNA (cytosine-5)-methyltransferase 1 [Clostridium neonatale]
MKELIIDNFAGGGGASTGIELAIGRSVDIAINHDPAAIAMHKANHPNSKHYCESVWEVDPLEATAGEKVGLAWFSPDCKHFSKAKGGKPVEKKIRGLAWIVLKWAGKVRPRVIILENVEEFQTWGPLKKGRPIKNRKGETFRKWKEQLESLGYVVDHRELKACDYGAPTIRKRFFLIARCDGKKIVWPEPTHGNPNTLEVQAGLLKPWKTAADIIDWNIPCKSIFERSKPLAENTLKRIAKGLEKFVFNNPEPFIVSIGQTGFSKDRSRSIHDPLNTIVSKAEACLVTPTLIQYHTETSKTGVRGQRIDEPIMTLDSSPRYGLVSAFISKSYAGASRSVASSMNDGIHTITARPCHSLVEIKLDKECSNHNEEVEEYLKKYYGKPVFGDKATQSFLIKYYGNDVGQDINTPLGTVVSKDRFGLITIKGIDYQISDIGLRMLEPHELFAAQGFPKDYIIDHDCDGKAYPKTKQVARCGNAVPPPFAKALVAANLPEICKKNNLNEVG